MALLIRGKSECLLCGRVISADDQVVAFPAFLKADHRLGRFSDGVFHRPCFESCPQRDEVAALYERFRQIWNSRPLDASAAERDAWAKEALKDFR